MLIACFVIKLTVAAALQKAPVMSQDKAGLQICVANNTRDYDTWGVRVASEKPSMLALVLKYFQQFMGQSTLVKYARRLHNSYNHAHAPGQHMWLSPGPWLYSKCSKQAEV